MKLLSVVGARPQFIKASPLSRALRRQHQEILVHTGQHYDAGMSDVFFEELAIPTPDYHLAIGSGAHGAQTGAMLAAIERVALDERPDILLVYGDTNSTLAGALVAAKLHIPVAHVEAGLRSFNRAMPEEINRVLTDHVSTWLFAPSAVARGHLAAEGITAGVHVVGDIQYDAVRLYGERAAERSSYPAALGLAEHAYYLCTIHRAENTDDARRLGGILAGLERLDRPVVLPLHPRTRKRIDQLGLQIDPRMIVLEPIGYLDMLRLQQSAAAVLTDSGGIQKEAYYLGTPCITLRDETEWVETVEVGWNTLVGAAPDALVGATSNLIDRGAPRPDLYGSGDTAGQIVATLADSSAS